MFATVQGRFSALTFVHAPIFVFPLLLINGSIPMWFGRFEDSIGIFPEFIDGYNILILPTTGRYFQVSIAINLVLEPKFKGRYLQVQVCSKYIPSKLLEYVIPAPP